MIKQADAAVPIIDQQSFKPFFFGMGKQLPILKTCGRQRRLYQRYRIDTSQQESFKVLAGLVCHIY